LNDEISDICRATYRSKKACIDDDTPTQVTFAVGRLLLPKLLKVGVNVTSELRCARASFNGFPNEVQVGEEELLILGRGFHCEVSIGLKSRD
jgi:hypothetical protein